jgi:hypothetical protein
MNVNCQNSEFQSSIRSFTIEVAEEKITRVCSSEFGHITINNENEIPSDSKLRLRNSRLQTFLLKPKITTTDENLRNISPKK